MLATKLERKLQSSEFGLERKIRKQRLPAQPSYSRSTMSRCAVSRTPWIQKGLTVLKDTNAICWVNFHFYTFLKDFQNKTYYVIKAM